MALKFVFQEEKGDALLIGDLSRNWCLNQTEPINVHFWISIKSYQTIEFCYIWIVYYLCWIEQATNKTDDIHWRHKEIEMMNWITIAIMNIIGNINNKKKRRIKLKRIYNNVDISEWCLLSSIDQSSISEHLYKTKINDWVKLFVNKT